MLHLLDKLNSIQFNLFSSSLEAHAQQHVRVQYNILVKTMKVKKEYSANVLELVKERTSPMPTQR